MESADPPDARLFVLLSQNRKRNIVLRRGPSRQVACFLWDRTNDTFELGQWLKGKVYDHRADISPDGKHWIYLALGAKTGDTWTAVSLTPWFTASDYYPWGSTWGGGGFFVSDSHYELNGGGSVNGDRQNSGLNLTEPKADKNGIGQLHWGTIFNKRLLRDGWEHASLPQGRDDHLTRFSKHLSTKWTLMKCVGGGQRENRSLDQEKHVLINRHDKSEIKLDHWEWADVDDGTIVWAMHGKIFRAPVCAEDGIGKSKMLHDFNNYKFEQRAMPYSQRVLLDT